jgi:hypothetical protein
VLRIVQRCPALRQFSGVELLRDAWRFLFRAATTFFLVAASTSVGVTPAPTSATANSISSDFFMERLPPAIASILTEDIPSAISSIGSYR